MARLCLAALLLLVAPCATANLLRLAPVKPHEKAAPANPASTEVEANPGGDEAEVTHLRAKLTKISGGLSKLLAGPEGKGHVGSMISTVNAELQHVLMATKSPKDMKAALKQLQEANASVKQLGTDITNEQMKLMHEGEEQEESLLLGVLMQRQNEPMSKQLEVAQSPEFSKLPAVVAVLAVKDMKTPLFKQIATYLDKHSPPEPAEPQIPAKLKKGKDGKPDVTPIVLALAARLQKMEEGQKRMAEHHAEEMKELGRVALEKQNNTRAVLAIKSMKKHDDRTFAKQAALAKHDIQAMKAALEAVKKGDMAGLARAQNALVSSMKAAQARSGKFLVFVQLMHRAEGLDCPYCAAQCVDKCHNEGKPYVSCLTACADAGKGK